MRARGIFAAAVFLTTFGARAQGNAVVPAAAQAKFAEGAKFEERKQLFAAQDSYKQALKAAGKDCMACLDALARVDLNIEAYKDSADAAAQMAAHASDPKAKAQAEYREGLALYRLYFAQAAGRGEIAKDEKRALATLVRTESILKQGEVDDPGDEALKMLHGRALAALKQDESASQEFTACATATGTKAEECTRALHFAKDVSLAREEPASAFELVTADGKKVSLDSLAGKIVLIDFWTTWCSVCERDSGYVQSMLDTFDDGRFVLLEVSGDEDVDAWRNFLARKRVHGIQTHDDGKTMQGLFHVTAFPTYVVIDGDGVMRMRALGTEGDLKGAVRKLLAADVPAAPDGRKVLPKAGGQ